MHYLLLAEPAWGIEPGFFKAFYQSLKEKSKVDHRLHAGIHTGQQEFKKAEPEWNTITVSDPSGSQASDPSALTFGNGQQSGQPATERKVAVISMTSVITKRTDWWSDSPGTKSMVAQIKRANQDPSIIGIILDTDSPGGTVDGTEEMAKAVKNSKKPVVVFVDGMAASAAYWIASQASYIIIGSGTTSRVGSIGTLIMHVDQSGYLEQIGLKVTMITADASTDKVLGNSYEPLSDKALDMFKSQLNIINDSFISYVNKGRGKKLEKAAGENVFTGKMYHGDLALKYGLVDAIGSMDDAVAKVVSLSAKQEQPAGASAENQENQLSINNQFTMKFPKIAAFFSWTKETAENPTLTAEDFSKLETALTEKDGLIATLMAEKETALTEKSAADAKVTELTTSNTQLSATNTTQADQIATLEKWKAESGVKDTKQNDELNDLNKPTEKSYNQAAYNQKAGVKA